MTASAPGTPLARLLAIAYRQLIEDLHQELRERGWDDVRPAYGFVLLAARETPVTVSGLAAQLGMTKQAASKLAEAMTADGLLDRQLGDGADGRQRPLVLSPRGHRLLTEVEAVYAELEAAWAARIGVDAVERLRRDLTTVVAEPDGSLPAVRPTW